MLESFLLYIFFPVMLCFSYWLFFTGVIGAIRMFRSRNWKTIKGKIVTGEIYFKSRGSEHSIHSRYKFVKQIQYSYSVKGEEYFNNQNFASDSLYQSDYKPLSKLSKKNKLIIQENKFLEEAKQQLNSNIGKPIMIYYDPNNPSRACLNNNFNKGIFMPIGMGLFFGFFLTLLFVKLIFQ